MTNASFKYSEIFHILFTMENRPQQKTCFWAVFWKMEFFFCCQNSNCGQFSHIRSNYKVWLTILLRICININIGKWQQLWQWLNDCCPNEDIISIKINSTLFLPNYVQEWIAIETLMCSASFVFFKFWQCFWLLCLCSCSIAAGGCRRHGRWASCSCTVCCRGPTCSCTTTPSSSRAAMMCSSCVRPEKRNSSRSWLWSGWQRSPCTCGACRKLCATGPQIPPFSTNLWPRPWEESRFLKSTASWARGSP